MISFFLIMIFYVAGSLDKGNELKKVIQNLEDFGHTISFDWTVGPILKPYDKDIALTKDFAQKALNGARACDVFLLFPDQTGGTGQFVELGAALFSERVTHVFVIGPHQGRSLMFFHPRVKRVASLEEALKNIA
jgi:hypothetical protein